VEVGSHLPTEQFHPSGNLWSNQVLSSTTRDAVRAENISDISQFFRH